MPDFLTPNIVPPRQWSVNLPRHHCRGNFIADASLICINGARGLID
jgi:hypothetical protein